MPFLLIMNLFNKNKINKIKEKLLIAKMLLIIIGIVMTIYIENSSNYCWLKEEFSQMKGIKLYTIFKIVEYILLLLNKYGNYLDFQLQYSRAPTFFGLKKGATLFRGLI